MNTDMKRLDVALCGGVLGDLSRTQASELIKQGKIAVDGRIVLKPSELVSEKALITLTGELPKYVGRGGYKLETAIEKFKIELSGCVCIDIGASTGGFTDCMLQNGAERVYAVDVGTEQLHEKLKLDQRVISLEKLDIRNASETEIPEKADFIGIDVSFISLKLIIPCLRRFLNEKGKVTALIKPQFEAGKKHIKNGVLRDYKEHLKIIREIEGFTVSTGYSVLGTAESKITGRDGNREYIICFEI